MAGFRTTGDCHKDAKVVKEHSYFKETLEEIRGLLMKTQEQDKNYVVLEIDKSLKALDYRLS